MHILHELHDKNKAKMNNNSEGSSKDDQAPQTSMNDSCGCSHEEPEPMSQKQSGGSCGCSHEEPEPMSQKQSGGSCGCSHEEPEPMSQKQSGGSCGCSHEEPVSEYGQRIQPESMSQKQSGGSCGCSHEEPEPMSQKQSGGSCGCSHEESSHSPEHTSASLIQPESMSQTQSGGSCGCSHEESSHSPEHTSASLIQPESMSQTQSDNSCGCSHEESHHDDLEQKTTQENSETKSEKTTLSSEHDVIFIGDKPLMTYVTHTLTQLAIRSTVTLKARGRKITHAADVSQMIEKRMGSVGYKVMDVRISSDLLTHEGKERKVPTIEIDLSKN